MIAIMGFMTKASAASQRAIHSVVLKVVVNYLQLAATAMNAAIDEQDQTTIIRFISDFTQSPLEFVSLECAMGFTGMKYYEIVITLGFVIIPFVLTCTFL